MHRLEVTGAIGGTPATLERIRQLYKIGDGYTDQEYLADRHRIQREIDALAEVPGTRDYEAAVQVVADLARLWRGSSDQTRKAILTTIFEEIRVRRNEVVQIKPRPRYVELVTLGMLNGLQARRPEAVSDHLRAGDRCGRGERT